jgi:hypothetical protein
VTGGDVHNAGEDDGGNVRGLPGGEGMHNEVLQGV